MGSKLKVGGLAFCLILVLAWMGFRKQDVICPPPTVGFEWCLIDISCKDVAVRKGSVPWLITMWRDTASLKFRPRKRRAPLPDCSIRFVNLVDCNSVKIAELGWWLDPKSNAILISHGEHDWLGYITDELKASYQAKCSGILKDVALLKRSLEIDDTESRYMNLRALSNLLTIDEFSQLLIQKEELLDSRSFRFGKEILTARQTQR